MLRAAWVCHNRVEVQGYITFDARNKIATKYAFLFINTIIFLYFSADNITGVPAVAKASELSIFHNSTLKKTATLPMRARD